MSQIDNVYYVSCQGNDTWDGSKPVFFIGSNHGPFQTILAAKNQVRKRIQEGLKSDIVIEIREGDYFLKDSLIFDEQDSGTDDYRIIYRNYEDEKPVISGGRLITKWQPYEDNIYVAEIGKNSLPYSLFENGKRCTYARYPKEGYSRAIISEDDPFKSFKCDKKDLPEIINKENLQVYIWPGGCEGDWNWFTNTINIASIDENIGLITLQEAASYELGTGSRYFIQGALALLSQPGEFYVDKKEGKLYYWPPTQPIEEQNIIIPIMKSIISFKGSSVKHVVRNIELSGVTIMHSDRAEQLCHVVTTDSLNNDGTICLENAENINIKNCKICNTGSHGIYIKGYAQNNLIYGNMLHDIGETGVYMEGVRKPHYFVSKNNTIMNNHICDTGKKCRTWGRNTIVSER